jgi:hypothetical protein
MAKLQAIDNRIPERTDADLERARVLHQGAGVQSDKIVHRADGEVRRAVQIIVIARMFDDEIQSALRDLGTAEHERQLAIHNADGDDLAPAAAGGVELR